MKKSRLIRSRKKKLFSHLMNLSWEARKAPNHLCRISFIFNWNSYCQLFVFFSSQLRILFCTLGVSSLPEESPTWPVLTWCMNKARDLHVACLSNTSICTYSYISTVPTDRIPNVRFLKWPLRDFVCKSSRFQSILLKIFHKYAYYRRLTDLLGNYITLLWTISKEGIRINVKNVINVIFLR